MCMGRDTIDFVSAWPESSSGFLIKVTNLDPVLIEFTFKKITKLNDFHDVWYLVFLFSI